MPRARRTVCRRQARAQRLRLCSACRRRLPGSSDLLGFRGRTRLGRSACFCVVGSARSQVVVARDDAVHRRRLRRESAAEGSRRTSCGLFRRRLAPDAERDFQSADVCPPVGRDKSVPGTDFVSALPDPRSADALVRKHCLSMDRRADGLPETHARSLDRGSLHRQCHPSGTNGSAWDHGRQAIQRLRHVGAAEQVRQEQPGSCRTQTGSRPPPGNTMLLRSISGRPPISFSPEN